MTVIQIGLVDTTNAIDPALVEAAAAALNVQVIRDLPPFWNVQATVRHLPSQNQIPAGIWPVLLVPVLPEGEGEFHLDQHNQPYAKVAATRGNDGWTIAASHETIEMLIDPAGNRLQSSTSIEIVGGKIQDGSAQFEYLVEGCDPVEAEKYSYSIQGIAVSDFITPHFYDPVVTSGTRYSFTGALTKPREILPGGYISWIDLSNERIRQLQYLDPSEPPTIVDLGPSQTKEKSLREWLHTKRGSPAGLRTTRELSEKSLNEPLLERCRQHRRALQEIASQRAKMY
ncbi:hypothetical protein [Burkholderia sp. MSMB1498]|uniref:hypothetical protein n=1 Tax=Burkholderia sp. MSMB1498 TaxID=1637842 RepID=UPI00075C22E3|nr:hypothetical protein [Burkholderia sp. MSMB1498]KVK82319.1 hypothetical protein WS91_10185 [Burkholderia sp. MSMB1498]